jgi:hypothetical protein
MMGVGGTTNGGAQPSVGYGAGGCGANANAAGKIGMAGIVIVWEYK